jgi:alpha-1,3-rhamnosyl/mannosyltransferase
MKFMGISSLHVGFDVTQTGSKKKGCGYYAHSIANAMMALHETVQFSLFPSFGDYFFDLFMPIKNPYTKGIYGPRHLTRQAAGEFWNHPQLETNLNNPDIIHANNFWCPTQLRQSRLIYTLYDLSFVANPEWTTELNRASCFEGMFRSALCADWIVAISEASRQHYLELFPHFPAERISVIYPCSRYHDSSVLGKKPKALQAIPDGEFWLSVGTIEPRKNQKLLVKAYADYLIQHGKPMPLVFAGGKGWLMEDFNNYIQQLGVDGSIIFTDYVSDEELIWLYRNCYAHIYPSLFEGFGLPVLEGMQFGAATITSNTTSIPEVSGQGAISIPPEDSTSWTMAMLKLANDSKERELLSEKAKQRAVQFSWQDSANALLSLYEKAMTYPKRTPTLAEMKRVNL